MSGSRQAKRLWPPTIGPAEDEYARSVGFASGAERREAIRRDDERKWRREMQRDAELAQPRDKPAEQVHAASAKALRDNGVTACEITPERYRADQIALGIEPAEAADTPAAVVE